MKKRILIAMIMSFVLISVAVFCAWAQDATMVGVKAGDNFTYRFYVLWSSTGTGQVVPEELSDWNRTISIHLAVTDVVPTIAYIETTRTMSDGTNSSSQGFIDVNSGRGVDAQLFIIGANLAAGDKAYPESTAEAVAAGAAAASFTIDETLTRSYLGTSRTVNRCSERTTNVTSGDSGSTDAYYDKETGILLEMNTENFLADTKETLSLHWKIIQFNSAAASPDETDGTDSTSWLPSWFVPVVIVVPIAVVAVLAVAIFFRRRNKRRTQTPR